MNEDTEKARSSIIAFIKTLQVTDSHYSRKKTVRQYLPNDLSLAKLYKMWLEKQQAVNEPTASISLFKNVFYTCFNIGFGFPSTDICSKCSQLEKRIAEGIQVTENELQLRLHQKKAEKFYELVRESGNTCDIFSLTFDMQQNQPIPETGLGEEYYKRQLWYYNLGIVVNGKCQKRKSVRFYTWSEHESGKGSNEVCSALWDCLRRFRKMVLQKKYRQLDLICDSCPGQNKNSALVGMLLRYINSEQCPFQTIRLIFPVKGHSYMPPDRVFGRVERQYRRSQRFITPNSYDKILEKFGIIRRMWKD